MLLLFRIFLLLVVCVHSIGVERASAQKKFCLSLQILQEEKHLVKKSDIFSRHTDSLAALQQLTLILTELHKQSYLLASADSLVYKEDTLIAYMRIGHSFEWAYVKPGNVGEELLSETGYREKIYTNRRFSYKSLANLEEKILENSGNKGYPFASVKLDSVHIESDAIGASLYYQTGPYIKFDTIAIAGNARFKQKYLSSYFRIGQGQAFNQRKLDKAEQLLRQTSYVQVIQPTSVIFKNDRAYPVFYVNERKASTIDGIVGFLPNEQKQNRLLVTGELNLQLKNLFKSGKAFAVHWQQIRQASPRLNLAYEHPALLGTPLILGAEFNLLKEDSTFLSVNRYLSLAFHTGNAGKVKLYTGLKTSRLGNNAQYKLSDTLPVFSDYNLLYYGAGYSWNNLDDYFYPTKGVDFAIDGWAGNKRILKNPFLEQNIYENVALHTVQVSLKGFIKKYSRLTPRSILFTKLEGGKVINPVLFKNDLFRLGGLTSLRGFNENFFFASDYAIATLEYRYFMDPVSYFFLFYDQAYLQASLADTKEGNANKEYPLGIGAGVSFSTSSGIFSLVYSLSQSQERKLGLNFSKIHFGFTSRF